MGKVDVERHEMQVLWSAESLLTEHRIEHLVTELRPFQAQEATALLYGAGYMCSIATHRLGCTNPMLPTCYVQFFGHGSLTRADFQLTLSGLKKTEFVNVHCRLPILTD